MIQLYIEDKSETKQQNWSTAISL